MNFRSYVAFAACALALSACSNSDPDPPGEPEPNEPSELERTVAGRIDAAVEAGFSGAISVSVAGQRVGGGGHGLANRERGRENTEHTAFDVGSILKSFTAIAVFQLAEAGTVALGDTLADLLPGVPPDKAAITLRELVQHSAGFDEYHDDTGDFEPMTRLEARERILAQELLFEPGEDVSYSNSGYTLLADIIETASGEAYTDYVRKHLFEPAELTESGFYSEAIWQTVPTAVGYDASTFGDNDPATWPYTWALVGNGGLVTTVADLDRWLSALFGGKLVTPATFELIEEEYLAEGAASLAGEVVYGEAGAGDYGLGGVVVYAPASDLRVIVATNTYEVFDIESFAIELSELVLDGEFEEP